MPITQERVIAIIDAGLDYKRALGKLIQIINEERDKSRDICKMKRLSDLDVLDEVIGRIYRSAGISLLDNNGSGTILEYEAQHYLSTKSRNTRNRIKAEIRRREAGVKEQRKRFPGEPINNPYFQERRQTIISPPQAPQQLIRLDEDESNPENVEGGMFGESPAKPQAPAKPHEFTPEEEEEIRQVARDTMRKYNEHEK